MLLPLLLIALGIALCFGGVALLTGVLSRAAGRVGISPATIERLELCLGRSAPLVAVAVAGALDASGPRAQDFGGVTAGVVLGGGLLLLTAGLGGLAILRSAVAPPGLLRQQGLWLGVAILLVGLLLLNDRAGRLEGLLLLTGFVIYIARQLSLAPPLAEDAPPPPLRVQPTWMQRLPGPADVAEGLALVLGLVLLGLGAALVSDRAVVLTEALAVPSSAAGALAGAGLALPLLVQLLRSPEGASPAVLLEQVLCWLLLGLGLAALLHPFPVPGDALRVELPFLLASLGILLLLLREEQRMAAREGGVLLVLGGLYVLLRVVGVQ